MATTITINKQYTESDLNDLIKKTIDRFIEANLIFSKFNVTSYLRDVHGCEVKHLDIKKEIEKHLSTDDVQKRYSVTLYETEEGNTYFVYAPKGSLNVLDYNGDIILAHVFDSNHVNDDKRDIKKKTQTGAVGYNKGIRITKTVIKNKFPLLLKTSKYIYCQKFNDNTIKLTLTRLNSQMKDIVSKGVDGRWMITSSVIKRVMGEKAIVEIAQSQNIELNVLQSGNVLVKW